MRLFVGGINYETTERALQEFFESGGVNAVRVTIIRERETNKHRGFGFVEVVADGQSVEEVVKAFNGLKLDGRKLTVNMAKPRAER